MKSAFESVGYSYVREELIESARAILEGGVMFVSLPTGSGKSRLRLSSVGVRYIAICTARQVDCCRESTEGTYVGPSANFH